MLKSKKKILYLSFDGILEPLGDSQILQYILYNSKDFNFKIISFEKKNDLKNFKKLKYIKNLLINNSIDWKYYLFSKRYSSLSFFMRLCKMFLSVSHSVIFDKYRVIHIRSYLPGIVIIPLNFFLNLNIIFDMRGFFPLEKIERNGLKSKIIIRLLFYLEKKLIKISNKIITLTYHSKRIIQKTYQVNEIKIEVIRTCVNTNFFENKNILASNKNNILNLCFMGSLNKAYDFDEIILFIKNLLIFNKKIKVKFFTKDIDNFLLNKLNYYNIPNNIFSIQYYNKNELLKNLVDIDFGLFFLRKNQSVLASFPTKIGEFLSLGIPIITNNFNDDIKDILTNHKIGLIVDKKNFNVHYFFEEIKYFNTFDSKELCRNYSLNNLSLKSGSKKYNKIYKLLDADKI